MRPQNISNSTVVEVLSPKLKVSTVELGKVRAHSAKRETLGVPILPQETRDNWR
jgi:hypothetical protein